MVCVVVAEGEVAAGEGEVVVVVGVTAAIAPTKNFSVGFTRISC